MGDARLIDLSHMIEHGMITYKGLPLTFRDTSEQNDQVSSRSKIRPED